MKAYRIMARILLGLFIISFVYGIMSIIFSIIGRRFVYSRPYIEYIKISLQCILGSAVLFLPSALEYKFKISFSNGIHIFFIIFLYAAIILGEVQGYYRRFYHWDTVLHTLSGGMLSSFGFCIIDIINKNKRINLGLSDWFMSFSYFVLQL